MSDYEYGPLQTFEVVWASGHVEKIKGHSVHTPPAAGMFFGKQPEGPPVLRIYGMINGNWTLQLQAREDDIRTIRNVTTEEHVPGGEVR